MTWIDDTEKCWLAAQDRDARIEEQATQIYEDLWKEVLDDVTKAKAVERFAHLATNGRPLAHSINFPAESSSYIGTVPYGVEIALLKGEHRVVASIRRGDTIRFDIDICNSDGSACLKLDGRKVSCEEVSRRILTAFLYPGLPYVARTDNTLGSVMRASMPGHLKVPRIGI